MARRILNQAMSKIVNAERRSRSTATLQPISGLMSSFLNVMKHRASAAATMIVPKFLMKLLLLLLLLLLLCCCSCCCCCCYLAREGRTYSDLKYFWSTIKKRLARMQTKYGVGRILV